METFEELLSHHRIPIERYVKFRVSGCDADDVLQETYLAFWLELPQSDIAKRLQIPIGTVKSRLHTAKAHFKAHYPHPPHCLKGEHYMNPLPKILPTYTITPSKLAPFPVCWEEMMGWFIVPKLGERNHWGIYDMPERLLAEEYKSVVTGKITLHGIEGVEIKSMSVGGGEEHCYVVQLTDTHCRMLGERYEKDGIQQCLTFLDGDGFLDDWGFGEDNCGYETHLSPKGDIQKEGNHITAKEKRFLLDVVGRYTVTIFDQCYDTVCLVNLDRGVMTEQFLDQKGRTVLWRRYNADDWAFERYHQLWSEILSENEHVKVNGKTYVHWYDCISDYIL